MAWGDTWNRPANSARALDPRTSDWPAGRPAPQLTQSLMKLGACGPGRVVGALRTAGDARGGRGATVRFGPVPTQHMGTAPVVGSSTGNVVLTAAHCIAGSGRGVVFAPGYHDVAAAYGRCTVQRAYVAPAWKSGQDPHADYAFLVVTDLTPSPGADPIQAVIGGNRRGRAPPTGHRGGRLRQYAGRRTDHPSRRR